MKFNVCVLIGLLLLGGCDPPAPVPKSFAGLGQDAAAFKQVTRNHPLVFPLDHAAHNGFRIEWWYVTANLRDRQGRDWGAQWTLFRSALRAGPETSDWDSPNLWMGHAALTGPGGHQVSESLARGGIGQAGVEAQPFRAWINDWSLQGSDDISHLQMTASGKGFAYRLNLVSPGPLVLHGARGYSEKSGKGQASYYYSQPFYQVSGEVERDGQRLTVTGNAWLDREWSSQPLAAGQSGWDWFSLHLDSGAKLMLFRVRETQGTPYRAGTWISAEGSAQALQGEQIQLQELAWSKQENGREVPTRWRVQVPAHDVDVQVDALEPNAWMSTRFPYWEGPVRFNGSVSGKGYLEMTGY
ncbi:MULTISPECIES: lipocalin-like domain-containing protein [Pseudomonas]|jgi:predicted secreted hydrolase|uniref:Hydroxyneurosporene synthase family protein n=1 Tax=Pseudomonas wadenswilerensis TaxID=1785161 RepID=A0A380T0N7_9PSED|nr:MULTISPECIES: lipocalin-like domain-containing protein [Pseudomonas]UVM19916.1 iron ABC transporter permease [Pseudomonas wadenswilerensis]SPO66232.1 putative Lipoprotein [Pseudomonas sp. JV241A]SUQ63535.1 Hydroxyneurosporene synthase family protein [Pseudomonas wadenswilerensis]